jgi:glutaredoxin 3
MKSIEIFTKDNCPYCEEAKALINRIKPDHVFMTIYNLSEDASFKNLLLERYSEAKTVPQIFFDGVRIGGCDDLVEYIDNTTSFG